MATLSRPTSSPSAPYLRQIRRNNRDAQRRVIARLVKIGKFADGERRDTFRKIAVDAREQIDQVPAFDLGQTGEGRCPNLVRQLEDASEDPARLLGQDKASGAAVSGLQM